MKMRLALDTYRDIANGDGRRRIHALFTLGIWFAAGGYLFSSLGEYFVLFQDDLASIFGAFFLSALISVI